jgi:tRNA G18 (ribose-2'-O)-methylase SpoU
VLSRNDWFQRIDAVKRNRVKRKQYGECLVESVAAIDAAAREGWEIRAFIHADGASLSRWATGAIALAPRAMVLALAPHLMVELSDRDDTSELLALVSIRRPSVAVIPAVDSLAALLLDRPSSPGNLGSILRSADAFGATGVAIRGHAADLYDPQTIRSSLGAVFSVPVAPECSNEAIVAWTAALRAGLPGFQVIGTSAAADRDISAVDLKRPTLVVLGNERTGMSEWLRAQVDETARIPIGGSVDSLNLAAAATVLLYELARQRGSSPPEA